MAVAFLTLPLAFPAAGPGDVQAGKAGDSKPKPSRQSTPPNLTDIKAISGGDHARVTLFFDSKAEYESAIFAKPGKGKVRRVLAIDLRAGSSAVKSVPAVDKSGPVDQIRVLPHKQGPLRVELDLDDDCAPGIFTMDGPFRIVVDVNTVKKTSATSRAGAPGAAKPQKSVRSNQAKAEPEKSESGDKAQAADDPVVQPVSYTPVNPDNVAKNGKAAPYKLPRGSMGQADSLVRQLGLTVRTVMIDAGHGGKDNGATGVGGLLEKNVNLALAKALGAKLAAQGFDVRYTRTKDVFVPLAKRTEMANDCRADLFISIHCNAHDDKTVTGLETYSMNLARSKDAAKVAARENASEQRRIGDLQAILTDLMQNSKIRESGDLAGSVHSSVIGGLRRVRPIRDHGVHEAPFFVLLGARMPAVLVEVGYITNADEARALSDKAYLDKLATSLASGVSAYKARIAHYASL